MLKENRDLNKDHVGHMVEYLVQNLKLEDLSVIIDLVEDDLESRFEEAWKNREHVERCITQDLDEGVTEEHFRKIDTYLRGSWPPDFFVQYSIRGKGFERLIQVIYPVELKCNSTKMSAGQKESARKYNRDNKGRPILMRLNTSKLPEKLDYRVKFKY